MQFIKAIKNYGIIYCIDSILVNAKLKKELSFSSKIKIQNYLKSIPNKEYPKILKKRFKNITGEELNLENPQTFNEKIQWLKIYDSTPQKTLYADKYLVRKEIKEKIGSKYLIPIIGEAWENANDIDFFKLPDKFVLKCNHGSGMNIIIKDKNKINQQKIKKKLNRWLQMDYAFFWQFCDLELHYSKIHPIIYAEKFIEEMDGNLHDYKIHCFNGIPHYIEVISDRNLKTHTALEVWYDINWKKQNFTDGVYAMNDKDIIKPDCLNEMINIAKTLSKDFMYARVDLYIIKGRIYFGEITFTSGSGTYGWNPKNTNIELGKLIKLQK